MKRWRYPVKFRIFKNLMLQLLTLYSVGKKMKVKTGVINDPLFQTHSLDRQWRTLFSVVMFTRLWKVGTDVRIICAKTIIPTCRDCELACVDQYIFVSITKGQRGSCLKKLIGKAFILIGMNVNFQSIFSV